RVKADQLLMWSVKNAEESRAAALRKCRKLLLRKLPPLESNDLKSKKSFEKNYSSLERVYLVKSWTTIPARLTTTAHLAISALIYAKYCSGVLPTGSAPSSRMRAFIS